MNLHDLIDDQIKFDSNHASTFNWSVKITENNIEILQYLFLALVGEFGELSNIIKKIARGDFTLDETREAISDELADCFIYIVKISYQLGIDLEKSFLDKLEKNRKKFKKYEINN